MKNYEAPKTRIKVVQKGSTISYYPQYSLGLFWGWQVAGTSILDEEFVDTLDEAKQRIDAFLKNHHKYALIDQEKNQKKVTTYIKYP